MKKVTRWSDVPQFLTEAEEAAFWATHELAGEALASMRTGPIDLLPEPPEAFAARAPGSRPHRVAIHLDRDLLRRVKAVAGKKHKGYQTLLREFVIERLYEEEKREGLLAS
jgi:hypothetical protein